MEENIKTPWIDRCEQRPEDKQFIVAIDAYGCPVAGIFDATNYSYKYFYKGKEKEDMFYNVSYWMPISEWPK